VSAFCRACSAEILWVTMADSGKRAPLDMVPTTAGSIAVAGTTARVLTGEQRERVLAAGNRLYVSHFATCSNPDYFRRKPESAHARLHRVMKDLGK
jgi:hypothetical protein